MKCEGIATNPSLGGDSWGHKPQNQYLYLIFSYYIEVGCVGTDIHVGTSNIYLFTISMSIKTESDGFSINIEARFKNCHFYFTSKIKINSSIWNDGVAGMSSDCNYHG